MLRRCGDLSRKPGDNFEYVVLAKIDWKSTKLEKWISSTVLAAFGSRVYMVTIPECWTVQVLVLKRPIVDNEFEHLLAINISISFQSLVDVIQNDRWNHAKSCGCLNCKLKATVEMICHLNIASHTLFNSIKRVLLRPLLFQPYCARCCYEFLTR